MSTAPANVTDALLSKLERTAAERAELARLLKQGQEAMAAKQYAEAVRALDQALLLAPSDAAATKALAEAREAGSSTQVEPCGSITNAPTKPLFEPLMRSAGIRPVTPNSTGVATML